MNQIKKIKGAIHSQLPTQDLQSLVKEIGNGQVHEDKIKEALLHSGIIEELSTRLTQNLLNQKQLNILHELNIGLSDKTDPSLKEANFILKPSLSPMLVIGVKTGRAFLSPTEIAENPSTHLSLHIQFKGHRFESKPVLSQSDPPFQAVWNIDIQEREIPKILETKSLMHFVVFRTDAMHHRSLLGTAILDVRNLLLSEKSSMALEITDVYDSQLVVGILDLYISQNFFGISSANAEAIALKLKKQESNQNDKYKVFVQYTKQWWNDYLQIRSSHCHRLVKLFVHTESGRKESVTQFISPMKSKLLISPRHAARFVSLIPFEKSQESVMTKGDVWMDLHTFLSLQKGDIVEHAILLCNLLLGFSLNAYVTLGLDKNQESHVWVTTVDSKGHATFWESLTGQTFVQNKPHHFRTIDCCFNHESFYANIQPSNAGDSTRFDFANASLWKALSSDSIASIQRHSESVTLLPHPYRLNLDLEKEVQAELVQLIASYRQDHCLSCQWDDDLSHLLGQTIWRLEMSKILATPLGEDKEFEMGIVTCIPEGHIFKGYPAQFNHIQSHRIFFQLSKNKSFKEILSTKGDKVRFGIQVKLFPYAEGSVSVWIMIAVRFQKSV